MGIGRISGNLINSFFGVDTENLDDLWKLMTIQAACCLIPLFFIWLLPTQPDIEAVQKKNKEEEAIVAKGHPSLQQTAETEAQEPNANEVEPSEKISNAKV